MSGFFSTSIRRKLNAAILVSVFVSTLVASSLATWRETERRFETKRSAISAISAALASTTSPGVVANDRRSVAQALNAISAIPEIKYAVVVDTEGRRIHEIGNGIVVGAASERLQSNKVLDAFSTIRLGTYLASSPIINGGVTVGTLSLIADVSELQSALWDSALGAIAAGLFAAAIGIAVSARLQTSIVGPVQSLSAATIAIRNTGDYSQSVTRSSADETGHLVDSFNAMMGEVRERDVALTHQRDRLADQVRERTCELAAAKDAADMANAAKSQFLAAMSHEIRTPMNGMLVMAELLANEDLGPRARRQCETIVKSGNMLLTLINDILDLSKIEAGHLELESIPLDPDTVVTDVVQLFSDRASKNGLEIACHVSPSVPKTVLGDPLRLTQVLSNLVNNALKFTDRGGVLIDVSASPMQIGGTVVLEFQVSDTGIGIADDKLATLFDAFTQTESSMTRRYGGTGIGLTICRQLVAAAGGEIGVSSKTGIGSRFVFTMPMQCVSPAEETGVPKYSTRPVFIQMPNGPSRSALTALSNDLGLAVTDDLNCDDACAILIDSTCSASSLPRQLLMAKTPIVTVHRTGQIKFTGESLDVSTVIAAPIGGLETRNVLMAALRGDRPALTQQEPTKMGRTDHNTAFSGLQVLAVDDNPVNREVLGEVLRRLGVQVTEAVNGVEAVHAVKARSFDLVFMDGSMPEMDGFEATRLIRHWEKSNGCAPLPIVGLTAHALGPLATRWKSAGMDAHITKPFTLASIREQLTNWTAVQHRGLTSQRDAPTNALRLKSLDATHLIDTEVLRSIEEIQEPGDDLVQRIIGLYIEHTPQLMDNIISAQNLGGREFAEAAHALKSMSRNIGATAVGDLCDAIETSARLDDAVDTALIARLAQLLSQSIVELNKRRALCAA